MAAPSRWLTGSCSPSAAQLALLAVRGQRTFLRSQPADRCSTLPHICLCLHTAGSVLVAVFAALPGLLFGVSSDLALEQALNVLNDERARDPVNLLLVLILATARTACELGCSGATGDQMRPLALEGRVAGVVMAATNARLRMMRSPDCPWPSTTCKRTFASNQTPSRHPRVKVKRPRSPGESR